MDIKQSFALMIIVALCLDEGELKSLKDERKTKCGFSRIFNRSKRPAPAPAPSGPPELIRTVMVAKTDNDLKLDLQSGRLNGKQVVLIFVNGSLPLEMAPHINQLSKIHYEKAQLVVVDVNLCEEYARKYSINVYTSKPTYLFRVLDLHSSEIEEECRYVGTDNYSKDRELVESKIKELTLFSKFQVASSEADVQKKLRNHQENDVIYTIILYFYEYSNGCGSCREISSTFDQAEFVFTVFILVDVDICPETAVEYRVDKNCLPAMAYFDNLKEPEQTYFLVKNIDIETTKYKISEFIKRDFDKYDRLETDPVHMASKEEDVRDALSSNQNKLIILYFYTKRDLTILKNIRWYAIDLKALAMEVDVRKCPNIAAEYKVDVDESKLPVFVIFFNGKGNNNIHRVNEYNNDRIRNKLNEVLLLRSQEVGPKDI